MPNGLAEPFSAERDATLMIRKVLVVEDEQDIAKLIKKQLEDDLGCEVKLAFDGFHGWSEVQTRTYNLIVLDWMLPGIDGLEICRRVRAQPAYTPILMLTAKSSEFERVLGLELGADDYLTKPFSMLELVARIRAIFRRGDALASSEASGMRVFRNGELTIDPVQRAVTIRGRPVELTTKEFDLLLHFAQNPGRVYTRTQLLDAVWGYDNEGYEHAVNCLINRLRAKIEENHAKPTLILTVWGHGYKLASD